MSDYPKDDGEPLVILWEWRDYTLDGNQAASVEDAAISAAANWEEGRAELGCIEVVNPDGTAEIITDYEAHLPPPPPKVEGPPKVAGLWVKAPEHLLAGQGGAGFWRSFHETHEAAEAEADRWRARLGDDRVEVRPL